MSLQINDSLIKELIKLSLKYREKAGFGSKLTETAIQKTLYELKRNLPSDNPIKEQLPYYWFKAGAYSEFVTKTLEKMTQEGVLKIEEKNNYKLFELNKDFENKRFVEHDTNLELARQILQRIVENLQPFSIDHEIKSQYEEDAPFLFYPRFKLGFMPNLEGYYNAISKSKVTNHNQTQRECLSKLLNVATASLPMNSLFAGFKRLYFDYETSFYRISRWHKNDKDDDFQKLIKDSINLSYEIWDAFAYGARIVKHDPIYDERIDSWKKIFFENVSSLTSKLAEFYTNVLEKTKPLDFEEQVISLEKFVNLIVKSRKQKQITFINFQSIPRSTNVFRIIDAKAKDVTESETFLRQGQLDWKVLQKLDDAELEELIRKCVSNQPIYVAYSDKGPTTVTYRIELNSLPVVEQIGNPV